MLGMSRGLRRISAFRGGCEEGARTGKGFTEIVSREMIFQRLRSVGLWISPCLGCLQVVGISTVGGGCEEGSSAGRDSRTLMNFQQFLEEYSAGNECKI